MKALNKLVPFSLTLLAMTSTCFAADEMSMPAQIEPQSLAETPAEDAWQFGVAVPLWAPQINGNVTVLGHQRDVNVNFSQLKDHLDASLALGMNAQKGKLGMFGNVGYMKFSGGFPDVANGRTDTGLKFLMANADVSYQLVKTESEHPFMLAATAGVRFWYISATLSHHTGFGDRDWHGYENFNLFDPVIGLRANQYLTRKLHLDVAGDYGGFNLSYNRDITWSASGMMTYDFAKWFSLSAGYQAVSLDVSEGSGNNQHGLDLIFNGVAAAATFKF